MLQETLSAAAAAAAGQGPKPFSLFPSNPSMFYRLSLKDGIRLINMHRVQEVVQQKKDLVFHFKPITDATTLGNGVYFNKTVITFDKEEHAVKAVEEVQAFVQAKPQMQ